MPKFKIETSLFEPVTIEIGDGRIMESVELTPALLKRVMDTYAQMQAGNVERMAGVMEMVGFIFGLTPAAVSVIDIRILNKALELVISVMLGGVPKPPTLAAAPAVVDEVAAEKNGLTPGGGISQ